MQVSAARFDAVVFDMDGVITDTASVHRLAWKRMFDRVLAEAAERTGTPLRLFDEQDYYEHVDGRLRQDGVASVLAARGITLDVGSVDDPPERDTVWGLANRKNRDFTETIAQSGVVAFPSSVALVRSLQQHGMGTAVISASRNCALILQAAGIGDLFPVRVDGIEAERLGLPGKPSPAVFLEAARRLRAEPARAVVVEDALAGVAAGRAGGFGLVVGVDRTGEAEALLANGADVVVNDLAEIRVVR